MHIGLDENYGNLDFDDIEEPAPIIDEPDDESFKLTDDQKQYLLTKCQGLKTELSIIEQLLSD